MSETPALHLVPPADDSAIESAIEYAIENAIDRVIEGKVEAIQRVTVSDDPTASSSQATAVVTPIKSGGAQFHMRMRGYDRSQVDDKLLADDRARVELETQLLEHGNQISTLSRQLEGTRRELRYWHDRQAFIDSELDRAREESARMVSEATERAQSLEQQAQERASTLEQQAQERTLKMVDRVCAEANEVMRHAREESHALAQRYHDYVARAQQRLSNMSGMQRDVVLAMRAAMSRFEEGMHELELVTPSALAAKQPAPRLNVPSAGTTTTTSTAGIAKALTSTLDTREQVSLGQSAAAAALSAAREAADPALETLRLMIEGSPAR